MDIDRDLEFPFSPSQNSSEDVVRWQSSQTSCAALQALLAQSATSTQESMHKRQRLTVWDPPSTTSQMPGFVGATQWLDHQPPDTAAAAAPSNSNPKPISSRSSRSTSGRHHHQATLRRSHTSPPIPTAPGDPSDLIALIQGVSARVDENAQIKTKYFNRLRASNAHLTRTRGANANANASTSSTIPELESGTDESPTVGYRSLPELTTSSSTPDTTTKQPNNTNHHRSLTSINTDSPSSSLHLKAQAVESVPSRSKSTSGPSSMPPPAPKAQHQTKTNASRSFTTQNNPNQSPLITAPSPSDEPRTTHHHHHPLVLAPNRPSPPSHPQPPPQPKIQPAPPLLRQSSRPPVLGMRRTTAYYNTSTAFTPSQVLPQKQKGFKPPLAHPPPSHPKPSTSTPPPSSSSSTVHRPTLTKEEPHSILTRPITDRPITPQQDLSRDNTQPPTSPSTDGDFSFGDIDMDALEETMKQYD